MKAITEDVVRLYTPQDEKGPKPITVCFASLVVLHPANKNSSAVCLARWYSRQRRKKYNVASRSSGADRNPADYWQNKFVGAPLLIQSPSSAP